VPSIHSGHWSWGTAVSHSQSVLKGQISVWIEVPSLKKCFIKCFIKCIIISYPATWFVKQYPLDKSISIIQSINESFNQSIIQSIYHWINHNFIQSTNKWINQSVNLSLSQLLLLFDLRMFPAIVPAHWFRACTPK